ncbi:6-hydroxymethylpterin diphosphokinase MptE-like protein [Desulfocurvus sp.]|jgi:hypothetical protein|uniref:motility associated factor glycosyltransferase family protein n=1 Tax=Desulfocurvus sp. TaxID=2871698 RepID=UPI0025B7F563|nr:6-hydroxymethylpterin diphosphokinase MptE-like protein [Desulfocurvus sp.]MCK9240821.1 DUF115 domain-containing protein [Desulfocurvus sp.]
MELLQFLRPNLEAMTRRGQSAAAWLGGRNLDLNALENQLRVNAFGLRDLALPSGGGTLFGAVPPQVFYKPWALAPNPRAARGATVLVGCNLGYGLNHVLTTHPALHAVLMVEPRPEMLALCLGMTDYRPFIDQGRLEFVAPDAESVWRALGRQDLRFIHGAVHLRPDTPSRQLGPEYARTVALVQKTLENVSVELNTLRKMQDVMVGNEIGNFRAAFARGSIAPLRDSAPGLAGLVVGAGPSLAELGPRLAPLAGEALTVTALQTLPAARALGITPDLCMAIDYSPGIVQVFERLDHDWAASIPFIYSTKVQPEVVRRYPGPAIPMWTLGGLATFLMHDREPVLDAGGNVSVALLRLLAWCGASRVTLAGQDFAWSGERSHVAGHHAQLPVRAFDPQRHIRLRNMEGGEIISTLSYISAQRDMEADIARLGIPVYNVYGGGVPLEGAEVVGPDEVAARGLLRSQPGALERFQAALRRAGRPRPVPVFEPRARQWGASLRAVQKRLGRLYGKAGARQDDIRQTLEQVLLFLKQDPLYTPYLYNEIMDLAGLARLSAAHAQGEFPQVRRILERALAKVREVDRALGADAPVRAA